MTHIRLAALLLLFLPVHSAIAQSQQNPADGVLQGVVIDAVTKQPIEDARLILFSTRDVGPGNQPSTASGAGGTFSFTGLKPNAYVVEITANGYARQNYGQKTFPGDGTPIEVVSRQPVKGIIIAMVSTGTVSGRVMESSTRTPAAGVPVKLLRFEYDFDGQRHLNVVGSARTNDRGEYRLFFVTPGRYYVNAGGFPSRNSAPPPFRSDTSNEVSVTYGSRYFPGVESMRDASLVEVKPGADVGAIDFGLSTENLFRIRGRVLDSRTGQPTPSPNMVFNLYRRTETQLDLFVIPSTNYRRTDGSFELRDLAPGSYVVETIAFQGDVPHASLGPARFAISDTPVEISDADVDGLLIQVSLGATVTGKVRMEGQIPLPPALNSAEVVLVAPNKRPESSARLSPPTANGDAAFKIENVAPAAYRVRVDLPSGLYVKEASFGGVDALRGSVQISERETSNLSGFNVVISSKVASVAGSVMTDRLNPATGSLVVLVPERDRDRRELFQTTYSDSNGNFKFSNVVPGTYKVFAWESLEPYAYFDPDVLKQVETRGKMIELGESATQNVTLTVIPTNN